MGLMDKFKAALAADSSEDSPGKKEERKRERPDRKKPSRGPQATKGKEESTTGGASLVENPTRALVETTFALDEEEDFLAKQQARYDEEMKAYEGIPDISVREQRVQDVLEVLEIPATFEIEEDVFLPQEMKGITFDLQVPQGYDQGQVAAFQAKCQRSIQRYYDLLTKRNQDIAVLASVIDKKQVQEENLRLQNEIAQGLNIMPTQESDDLENLYMEARLTIKRLEDRIRRMEEEGAQEASPEQQQRLDNLQDTISIITREKQALEEEVYDLKTRISYYEEQEDETSVAPSVGDHEIMAFAEGDALGEAFAAPSEPYEEEPPQAEDHLPHASSFELPPDPSPASSFALPLEEEAQVPLGGLPPEGEEPDLLALAADVEALDPHAAPPPVPTTSAFVIPQEDEEDSYFNPVDQASAMAASSEDPDEDDVFDQLMTDWSKDVQKGEQAG